MKWISKEQTNREDNDNTQTQGAVILESKGGEELQNTAMNVILQDYEEAFNSNKDLKTTMSYNSSADEMDKAEEDDVMHVLATPSLYEMEEIPYIPTEGQLCRQTFLSHQPNNREGNSYGNARGLLSNGLTQEV